MMARGNLQVYSIYYVQSHPQYIHQEKVSIIVKCVMYMSHIMYIYNIHVCLCTCTHHITIHHTNDVHNVIRDVERKTPEAMENENESCLRWDSNPRHSVLQTDALPTECPRQLSWQGPNQTSYTPVCTG